MSFQQQRPRYRLHHDGTALRGWCETEETTVSINVALHARAGAWQLVHIDPETRAEGRVLETVSTQRREVIDTGGNAHLENYVAELERVPEIINQRGFDKHLKRTVRVQGTRAKEEECMKDEDCVYTAGR